MLSGGGAVPCADASGTAIRIASAVRPAIESNENVSEHFMRLTVPSLLLLHVRDVLRAQLIASQVPEVSRNSVPLSSSQHGSQRDGNAGRKTTTSTGRTGCGISRILTLNSIRDSVGNRKRCVNAFPNHG